MGRSTQYIGLNDKAYAYLKQFAKIRQVDIYHDGEYSNTHQEMVPVENTEYESVGMFGETIPLQAWLLKSGSVVYECVQVSPWSSGPVIFTLLRDENDTVIEGTEWADEEIDSYL